MKRKCLAVGISICAVILLILGSLSNVVGYQSVKSDGVNDSPLFSVRTQRATNQQQNIITSQYIGKGRYSIPFPQRDNKIDLIRKFIDNIRTMDDDTFNKFIDTVVYQINHGGNLKDIDVKEFVKELRQIKENPQNIIGYRDANQVSKTYFDNFVETVCWFPGCIVLYVLIFILAIIVNIIFFTIQTCWFRICFCPKSMRI